MSKLMKKKATLADVALLAGVSKTSASKALLDSKGKTTKVSEKTAEKIRKAAEKLNYVPNIAARNLAKNRSGFIGYILSDSVKDGLNNSYFNRYLSGVESACRNAGYGLYVLRANLSNIGSYIFPEKMKQQSVDGIVAVGRILPEVYQEFERCGIPAAFLNRDVGYEMKFPTFCPDAYDGIYKAVERAASLKHKNFWYCRQFEKEDYLKNKFSNFQKQIQRSFPGFSLKQTTRIDSLPYDESIMGSALFEEWEKEPENKKPTFIFGDSKIIIAFLHKLYEAGLSCPKDISAATSADSEINKLFYPPLSSFDYDYEKIGGDSVRLLIEHLDKKTSFSVKDSKNDYPAKIIERKSIGRPK